jgi:hypothetical protein
MNFNLDSQQYYLVRSQHSYLLAYELSQRLVTVRMQSVEALKEKVHGLGWSLDWVEDIYTAPLRVFPDARVLVSSRRVTLQLVAVWGNRPPL